MTKQRVPETAEAPEISVIIPVFNAEKYLEKGLDSVLASTFSDLEIICVDDGSADRSMEILHAYSRKVPRIRILTQDHQFAGAARNAGIKAAAGKYIHFLDADDEIVPHAYEKLYEAAEASRAEVCECLYNDIDVLTGEVVRSPHYRRQNGCRPLSVFSGRTNARSLISGHVVPWNKLYLRDFLIQNNILFDGLICAEDRSFYFEVIFKAKKIVRIQDRLVFHRVNIPTSLDGSDIRLRHFDVEFRSFERIWAMVKDAPANLKKMVLRVCFQDSMVYYSRAIGTEYEEPIRNLVTDYWRPYLPVLDKGIRITYLGLIAGEMPGRYWKFIRFMSDQFREANSHSGWKASLAAKSIRAFFTFAPVPLSGKNVRKTPDGGHTLPPEG